MPSKQTFAYARHSDGVYFSRESILDFLAEEIEYTALNAHGTKLDPAFVNGMLFALQSAKEIIKSIEV